MKDTLRYLDWPLPKNSSKITNFLILSDMVLFGNFMIKKVNNFFSKYPQLKEWAWFIILWFTGLLTALTLSYPIKLLIKIMG